MLLFDGAFGLVLLGLWIFCVIDVIVTDESQCRNLPKLVWLLVVLILPDVGSIIWLVAGHPWQTGHQRPAGRVESRFSEYDRPARFAVPNPEDDEAFLRQLRERAEDQRRRAREERREDDVGPA